MGRSEEVTVTVEVDSDKTKKISGSYLFFKNRRCKQELKFDLAEERTWIEMLDRWI